MYMYTLPILPIYLQLCNYYIHYITSLFSLTNLTPRPVPFYISGSGPIHHSCPYISHKLVKSLLDQW